MASIDELWLVDFGEPSAGEPAHHRPALILGPPESFGPEFPFVIVCPLTTTKRSLSLHVEVEASPSTGLDAANYIQCELLRSVNRRRLVHRLGHIDPMTSQHVRSIVMTILDH
jgi:mRNA-degrading endonuclease toxin of MazEF toxin-antitoxin module